MSFRTDMEDAAFTYAADLRSRCYQDVTVYRYVTALDNRETSRRDHREAYGWAVRYTSGAETDARVWAGSAGNLKGLPAPKFHDRSVTVFTGPSADGWLSQDMLTYNADIIADFAGEPAAAMYTAAWSPASGWHAPLVPSVILKRFPVRAAESNYPWQTGPQRMFHLIMTTAEPGRITG